MTLSYRTVWISDVHLGTPACRADDLLEFLGRVEADRLFLVGDIIDLERMKSRPWFPDAHRRVIGRLIEMSNSGTEILYVPGNHDHEFRQLTGREIFGIPILNEAVHETADGRRMLVTHGDVLDAEIRQGTNLDAFGAAAYGLMMRLDVLVNDFRHRLGQDHLSLAARVKDRIAKAQAYIQRFEQVAANYADRRGFDGIICGHIHRPRVRTIGDVIYANDGDWVEHRTALAERHDGALHLLSFDREAITTESFEADSPLAA